VSAETFFNSYAERSGLTPGQLAAFGQRAYRCACGEDGCEGWQMLSVDSVEWARAEGLWSAGVDPADEGYAPGGETPQ
jgi:hypothetical protein